MCHLLKCLSRGKDSIFILYNYKISPHHKWVLILLNIAMKFYFSDYSLTCNSLYFGFQTLFPGSPFLPQHSVYLHPPSHFFNIGILLGSILYQVLTQPSIPKSLIHINTFMLLTLKSFIWACCCLLACISNHISPLDFPYASQTLQVNGSSTEQRLLQS